LPIGVIVWIVMIKSLRYYIKSLSIKKCHTLMKFRISSFMFIYVEFQDTFFVSNNMIPSKTYVRTKVTFNLIDNRYHNDNIIKVAT